MSSIELRGLGRRFGAGAPALVGIDLAIRDGERLAVLGPSGSGKSTLLRLVAGLDRPTEGSVWFDGAGVDDVPPHRRDVGMVFQSPTPHPHLDVEANLEFGLKARKTPRAERRRRVGEIAAMLRLEGLLKRRPATLSGGEKQRVAIGRAVVRRPAVLLLDEPFSSLDLPLRSALRRDLLDLHDRFRWSLIHVTHDQAEALAIGDRIAVLDRGRLVQCDTPRQVYLSPATPFVAGFVGSPPSNLIACEISRDPGSADCAVSFPFGRCPIPEGAALALGLAPGERRSAVAGVRPEDVEVRGPAEPARSRPGRIEFQAIARRLEFQGDAVLAVLAVGDVSIHARPRGPEILQEGDAVWGVLDLDRTVWFAS